MAEELGIDMFDECSYLPNQMMYWPSTPSNGEYLYLVTDGDWLNPDDILSAHPEWTDPARLPTSSRESEAKGISDKKQADPLEKDGIVGMFNNAYFPVNLAIDEFLGDCLVYTSASSAHRWRACPPSALACAGVKDTASEYAQQGTDAHSLCEYKLLKSLGQKAKDPTENLTYFDEEMADCSDAYTEFVQEQVEAAKQKCADPIVLVEQRLDFSEYCLLYTSRCV